MLKVMLAAGLKRDEFQSLQAMRERLQREAEVVQAEAQRKRQQVTQRVQILRRAGNQK